MIISCKKCGTTFRVNQEQISKIIKSYKCSVCQNEWEANDIDNVHEKGEFSIQNVKNVEEELEAIRTEVKKNTDKIEGFSGKIYTAQNNSEKQKKIQPSKVHNVKKKSVSQIAEEIAEASVKKNQYLTKPKINFRKKKSVSQIVKNNKTNSINTKTSHRYSIFFLILMAIFSSSIYFRSTIVGISYAYFPNHTDQYFPKLHQMFEKVKIPFNAELNKIEISNFGATYEKNAIKFFGNLKNNSSLPIITPSIKAIVVTEDGKILAETIIPISKKYISSKNELSFSYLFITNKNFDNTTVRATILKEIQMNS